MFKKTGCALALALFSSLAFAAAPAGNVGIGVAHSGNGDSTIFVPITLQGNLWIEPFLSYNNTDVDGAGETTAYSVGTGLFVNMLDTQHTVAYFGGRIGYVSTEVDPIGPTSNTTDGFAISPTIGFGFTPVDNVMLGAEAFLTYADVEDDNGNGSTSTSTGTQLFVRYFFAQ